MPRGDERRIGIKFHASVRKSNEIARQIDGVLAAELGDEYDIRSDGFCPPGWSDSEVSCRSGASDRVEPVARAT